jgi:ankyrin repeat protein
MTLLSLPNELLLAISETQDCQRDINAFARTNRRYYTLLNPFLYAYNVRRHQGSALHWAASQGELRTAQESLRQGAQIDSRNRKTRKTPLIQSVHSDHADIVALLLAHGADLHAKRDGGPDDAIRTAVLRNRAAVARVLLDNGVDANSMVYRGSLLHIAAQRAYNNRDEVARVLVEKGANIESMYDGETPLQVACRSGSVEVARCLIESGARLDTRGRNGNSLLHLATNEVKTVKLLVEKGADIEARDDQGETPLHLACWNGWVETAAFLLDQGADIEARSLSGKTPLLRGVLWECTVCRQLRPGSVTTLLLERGANPSRGNDSNITPLHCAASKANTELFKLLLQYGADVEPKSRLGLTPLHSLADSGSLESARHLLQKGADGQPRNDEGNTPLHLAAQRRDVEFVRLLLEAGADRLVKNHKGQLPVHLASEGAQKSEERQRKVIDLLEPRSDHQH